MKKTPVLLLLKVKKMMIEIINLVMISKLAIKKTNHLSEETLQKILSKNLVLNSTTTLGMRKKFKKELVDFMNLKLMIENTNLIKEILKIKIQTILKEIIIGMKKRPVKRT